MKINEDGEVEINVPKVSGRFIAGGLAVLLLGGYGMAGVTNVELHEAGIAVQMIGTTRGETTELTPGLQWWEPFVYDTFTYNIRAEQYDMKTVQSETNDGQQISADVSFEISLIPGTITNLHQNIGPDWYDEVVYPAAREAIRVNTSAVSSDQIYTSKGKTVVADGIRKTLDTLKERGIRVEPNLRRVEFLNPEFRENIEQKAIAAQKEIIEKRLAAAAEQTAIKVANVAEGQKQKAIKEAEAKAEAQRLEGIGLRDKKTEEAKGIEAIARAHAKGTKLQVLAYGAGEHYAQVKVAEALGDNFQVWGVPTGAPGTTSLVGIDKLVGKAVGAGRVAGD